jgi:two-component system, NarL family, response regulator YdfI
VGSAFCAKTGKPLIKIFILADSTKELARLTAIVRPDLSAELAAASLDRGVLIDQLEDVEVGVPVILLEHSSARQLEHSSQDDLIDEDVARILLVEQAALSDAIGAMKEADSAIRAVLPARASEKEILAAIQAVDAGLIVIHPDAFVEFNAKENERVTFIPEGSPRELPDGPIQQLSPRESEVLNLLADGLANKEIAWRLKISEHTVKFHITSIFNKLDASTRAEAVANGARRGLIIL